MSLRANIQHLAAAQGIVAVTVVSPAGPRELRGDESWSPFLDACFGLLTKSGEKTVRIVVGAHTVVVQASGDEVAAVVISTGHPIAKSLRRMIRRLAGRIRGPLPSAWVPPGASEPEHLRAAGNVHPDATTLGLEGGGHG